MLSCSVHTPLLMLVCSQDRSCGEGGVLESFHFRAGGLRPELGGLSVCRKRKGLILFSAESCEAKRERNAASLARALSQPSFELRGVASPLLPQLTPTRAASHSSPFTAPPLLTVSAPTLAHSSKLTPAFFAVPLLLLQCSLTSSAPASPTPPSPGTVSFPSNRPNNTSPSSPSSFRTASSRPSRTARLPPRPPSAPTLPRSAKPARPRNACGQNSSTAPIDPCSRR